MSIKTVFSLLFLLLFVRSNATTPRRAFNYQQESESRQFYFKSTSFSAYPRGVGETIVFDASGKKELYRINKYFDLHAYISNKGNIIDVTPQLYNETWQSRPLVTIYYDKDSLKKFYVNDIISDTSKLSRSFRNFNWYKTYFVHNDTLFLVTVDGKAIGIDINKGEIVLKENKITVLQRYRTSIPRVERTLLPNECPLMAGNIWLKIKGGPPFEDKLKEVLGKDIADYGGTWTSYLFLGIEVLRDDSPQLYYLEIGDKEGPVTNNALTKTVEAFLKDIKIDREELARMYGRSGCDTYVFESVLYFK